MAFEPQNLEDGFGRRFKYVRLSITEVCNFRCTYCLPDGWKKSGPHAFLQPAEIGCLAAALSRAGVRKVRLTGGEPSVRRDLCDIVSRISEVKGIEKVALTTNGWNLSRQVAAWRQAGLTHINVSVDSLDPATFRDITGHDRLPDVLEGIETALELGYPVVKVNAVLLKSTVDAGFSAWADYARNKRVAIRFIELMRTSDNADYFAANHVRGGVVREWLEENGWQPCPRANDDGPAQEFHHPDFAGRIGIIAPYSAGFCDGCNRLRVTARGKLRLCLFGEGGVDLRDLLQNAQDGDALDDRIRTALMGKAAGHRLHENLPGDLRNLAALGG